MRLESLRVQNFRNLCQQGFEADPELTVISGQNGQGKTNLLECVWLLTGSKSFRGSRDVDLVQHGEEFARIEGNALCAAQPKKIEIAIGGAESDKRGRSAKVNGVSYPRATAIAGIFTAVVFDPGHLSLVKGGPEGRRRFLDAALCQLYPGYVATLRRFARALTQKNALLKKYRVTPDADFLLDTFDSELAFTGEEITTRRNEYLAKAGPLARQIYSEISGGAEEIRLVFLPCCEKGGLQALMKQSRPADIKAGFCTAGPHREDFETFLSESSAKAYGSQGQQRSVALSLKLAEAGNAHLITGDHPVLLLDDVLSELDESRQHYLLSKMSGKQSFVTTCDATAFKRTAGKIVVMEKGEIAAPT